MWLAGPQWDAEIGFWKPDPEGMSLLFTTPALIYLGRARWLSPLMVGAWVALGLLLIPLLLYYNTGWWQFGYRFSLDFMVPVLVLLAIAAEMGNLAYAGVNCTGCAGQPLWRQLVACIRPGFSC